MLQILARECPNENDTCSSNGIRDDNTAVIAQEAAKIAGYAYSVFTRSSCESIILYFS